MTTATITIPAREVRPGDVLFGMTVKSSRSSAEFPGLWYFMAGNLVTGLYARTNSNVTVERPAPSDPIGTVRAEFVDGECCSVYIKADDDEWYRDYTKDERTDADVSDFPILWKPGMPIPTEGVQA